LRRRRKFVDLAAGPRDRMGVVIADGDRSGVTAALDSLVLGIAIAAGAFAGDASGNISSS